MLLSKSNVSSNTNTNKEDEIFCKCKHLIQKMNFRVRNGGYRGFKGVGGHRVVGKREVSRFQFEKLPFEDHHF